MILSLVSSALALTVPLRTVYTEEVSPGEPTVVSSALTASVDVSNPLTGASFVVAADELTVSKREASGRGDLTFFADPSDTVRTWALYYIDSDGQVIGDPQVVDIAFDADGNGAIAAREGSGYASALTINASRSYTRAGSRIVVSDGGTTAAYVGIAELGVANEAKNKALFANPDMTIMDAAAFAAYQELGLDAMIALDTYEVQLDGNLEISGLSVATNGVVESGQELQWDLSFYDGTTNIACNKAGTCTEVPVVAGTASYSSAIEAIKKKKTTPPRVTLKPADQVFETWDAGFVLSIEEDVRDLEVASSLVAMRGDVATAADIVSLDPGGFGVNAKNADEEDVTDSTPIVDIFIDTDCDDCGDYDYTAPPTGPNWPAVADDRIDILVYDEGGGLVANHSCTMAPTSGTLAGTTRKATVVGECTRDVAGTEVRRLRAQVGPIGTRWLVDMVGPAFASERTVATCEKGGGCTKGVVSVLGGRVELEVEGRVFFSKTITVTSTQFDLPFSYAADVDGLAADLWIDLDDPTRDIKWVASDDTLKGYANDVLVHTIDLDDVSLDQVGMYRAKGTEDFTVTTPTDGGALLKTETTLKR